MKWFKYFLKNVRGIKRVFIGLLIYTPLFLYQFYINFDVNKWVFIAFAIPSGFCLITGLFQMHTHKVDELDDSLKQSMENKKFDSH